MNKLRVLITAVALIVAASAHAQECSGGRDGGMDATGNQCNQPAPIAAATQAPAISAAARPVTPAARPATTYIRTPNKLNRVARATTPQGR